MPPSAEPTSTAQTQRALIRTQGARSNHKNRPFLDCEPAGHGIGRSRGGLTTKIHSAVDGRGRPLASVVTGGQRHDGAMLEQVLADIHVPHPGRGRPRTRPDAVIPIRQTEVRHPGWLVERLGREQKENPA
ncbi:transposase [Dietzia maris]|uniref:transposase n=1 Tax=Dietzia maris TaxID=37915 RepID=UPI0019D58A15